MDIDFTLIEVDWTWGRPCQCYIDVFRVGRWHLFYLEANAKHSGGGVGIIELFGVRVV